MNVVDVPRLFNAQCLVLKRSDPERGPYIDLLRDFDMAHQGRMYVSRVAVESMARKLGLLSGDEADLRGRVAELEAELVEANEELESLREFERSANYTMSHFGQKVRKKPGRKAREPQEA